MTHYSQSASSSGGTPAAQQRRFEVMLRRPENRVCFDCDSRQPRWASTNLGIFFCLRCAGIHRSMGVHISKVKSTNMDVWEPSMLDFIERVGNARGRTLYEHNMPDGARVKSYTDAHTAERLLRTKYERKQFYHPQFETILKSFLETPIVDEGPNSGALSTVARPTTVPVVKVPAPVMEDMWGAPVSSPPAPTNAAAHMPSTLLAQPATAPLTGNGARTSVSELFAHETPIGAHPNGPAPVWGAPPSSMRSAASEAQLYPQPHANAGPYSAALRAHTQPPPVAPSGTSNFSFLFQGSDAGPASAQPHANTDDLLQGGPSRAAESEIMSLFDSAPIVGSGGGGGGARPGAANGNLAWVPQVVRPYYKPEW